MQNLFLVTQNLLGREISRFAASFFLAATLAALTGCGSGQAIPTVPLPAPTDPATGPAVASIQLLASSPQIPSSGASVVDLTAIVLSATGQAISGKTVTFSKGTDSSAFFTDISGSGVSDTNGQVTAKLNLGGNKANRTIAISATADAATADNSVDVTGTTITISGNSSLAFGATTTLTFSVKDSAGTPLPNMTVGVASTTGNTISLTPSTGITNSSGQITATVTAAVAADDTISASAAGASATQILTISSASFAFTTPTANTDINLNTATPVSVNWKAAGVPVVGSTVNFTSSRGTVTATSVTDAAGDTPGVTITSGTAGPAIITASGLGGTPAVTLDVVFVATSASTATVQAVPGTVQFTTGSTSQTNNSSTISVVVRDAQNNLVKNASVSFNIVDPSGGSLTSSTGITDVSGSTSVTYVAGGTSSAQNGVTINATVSSVGGVAIAPVTGSTTLTVSGQSLLVRLGTDNRVGVTPQNANTKTYLAIVTDAAGNPVVGTTVQFALRPGRYQKGFFTANVPTNTWVQTVTATCANEDVNFNGILDLANNVPGTGEDVVNSSGKLEPGAVASVNATAVTDAAGIAVATLTYAKSFSLWTEVTLEARTSVTTNDPPTQQTFFLSGLAADYTPLTTPPPPIPFGSSATCTDTL
ncbi:MAG: Ig-like domain-containing protein [Burkholderiales bacterium]|nr:Ig-like domain-containing protein [Burkholderiales bacterium]